MFVSQVYTCGVCVGWRCAVFYWATERTPPSPTATPRLLSTSPPLTWTENVSTVSQDIQYTQCVQLCFQRPVSCYILMYGYDGYIEQTAWTSKVLSIACCIVSLSSPLSLSAVEFKGYQLLNSAERGDLSRAKKLLTCTPRLISFQHMLTLDSALVRETLPLSVLRLFLLLLSFTHLCISLSSVALCHCLKEEVPGGITGQERSWCQHKKQAVSGLPYKFSLHKYNQHRLFRTVF